jgi:hypothetical protein
VVPCSECSEGNALTASRLTFVYREPIEKEIGATGVDGEGASAAIALCRISIARPLAEVWR